MKMAYFFWLGAAVALLSGFTEARPGPGMGREVWKGRTPLNSTSGQHAPVTEIVTRSEVGSTEAKSEPAWEEKVDEPVQLNLTDSLTESERTEEDEVVCTESGTCYEKRLLTATVDYKNDGPNNPISDPPH